MPMRLCRWSERSSWLDSLEHPAESARAAREPREAYARHQRMWCARHHRHFASRLERHDEVQRLQAAARNQQRVGAPGALERLGAELAEAVVDDVAAGGNLLVAEPLCVEHLEAVFLEERLQPIGHLDVVGGGHGCGA